ncbi:DUF4249 domain-containing protein [Hymenobacter sp. BT189]|uniref:DUF4249 domain-containing protein n=1 Tax=Hymenobacter armeniacus TaxID=2771358 RepID=A0ABR8JU03_9BACT|nr:DUF4249 domain-containing protein [Hymenobacter armeniacus]
MTTIRLSRTYAIAAKTDPPAETQATVYIEDDRGARFVLSESTGKGVYISDNLNLSVTRKFRLHLNTRSGKEYVSDYSLIKITPAIDAVNWRVENSFLNLYVDTHDATGNTLYYRWETDEAWEIYPPYNPGIEYANNGVQPIVVRYPRICWGNQHSNAVQIAKTTGLTQDVVADYRLRQHPAGSERFFSRYSMLVQQHALSKVEYDYWELLRKNTESIGSLFDPQPSQVTGNVHCLSDPEEMVLGFIGAHSISEIRIFITRAELPAAVRVLNGYEACVPPDTMFISGPRAPRGNAAVLLKDAFATQQQLPIGPVYDANGGGLVGYTVKSRDCVDCRTRGSATKP